MIRKLLITGVNYVTTDFKENEGSPLFWRKQKIISKLSKKKAFIMEVPEIAERYFILKENLTEKLKDFLCGFIRLRLIKGLMSVSLANVYFQIICKFLH